MTSVLAALSGPGPLVLAGLLVIGVIVIVAALLFARTDSPAFRLVQIINAIRGRQPVDLSTFSALRMQAATDDGEGGGRARQQTAVSAGAARRAGVGEAEALSTDSAEP